MGSHPLAAVSREQPLVSTADCILSRWAAERGALQPQSVHLVVLGHLDLQPRHTVHTPSAFF